MLKIHCLLVKVKDGRTFFTEKGSYQHLLEFSRVCGAELHMVLAIEPPLVTLKELATYICDQNHQTPPTYYEILPVKEKPKLPYEQFTSFSKLSPREKILKQATSIRKLITTQFEKGKIVRVKDLARKLKKHDVSSSTLYRHVNFVKDLLETTGKTIEKISPGTYRLVQ